MTPAMFAQWLRGFLDAATDGLTAERVELIKERLANTSFSEPKCAPDVAPIAPQVVPYNPVPWWHPPVYQTFTTCSGASGAMETRNV